jgi:haloalkane dehalogenase
MSRLLLHFSFLILFISQISAQKIEVLKTPPDYFKNLHEYSFNENFLELEGGLRMHYLDEGSKKKPVVLLIHGEPCWSYIYRNIIQVLIEKGYRVVVPDLVGFGKSDKPINMMEHTYSNHTEWLRFFIRKLELKEINCYAHDWGAMLCLRIIAKEPELFSKIAVSYGFLFTGEEKIPESFLGWQKFSQTDSAFMAGTIINWGTHKEVSKEVQDAYNAPYPSEKYKTGMRKFPVLIPLKKDDPEAIENKRLREKLKSFKKPFLTIWGITKDEMWMDKADILQREIPGAIGQDHKVLKSGHFIQEDQGDILAGILIQFFNQK